MFKLKSQRTKN